MNEQKVLEIAKELRAAYQEWGQAFIENDREKMRDLCVRLVSLKTSLIEAITEKEDWRDWR